MMNHKPLRFFVKTVYFILVFFLTVFFGTRSMNQQQSGETREMAKASFPVVTMRMGEETVNTLFGYAVEQDVSMLRKTICLTGEDRSFHVTVDDSNADRVASVSFEVRTTDGQNLVEQTPAEETARTDEGISYTFYAKDLIEYDTEYMLVLLVSTHTGKTIRYYSRFLATTGEDAQDASEHIAFCRELHEMALQGNEALKTYLESSRNAVHTSVEYVDIHSPFSAVTFENVTMEGYTNPRIDLYDFHAGCATISLCYDLTLAEEARTKRYHVTEQYFTRKSKQGMVLLDFERTMNYVFTGEKEDINGNALSLSYQGSDVSLYESASGNAVAFVNEGRLFVYQQTENRLTQVFGFYTEENDVRTNRDSCDIRVLRMDEGGNLLFQVCGYQSSGNHEGETGTAVYEFVAPDNAISEMVFLPENVPEELLRAENNTFGYANYMGIYYFLRGTDLYAVNLYDGSIRMQQQNLAAGEYRLSSGGNLVAWQDAALTDTIHVLDMGSEELSDVSVGAGTGLRLLGFIESDMVYGEVMENKTLSDRAGNPVYPMHRVMIRNMDGTILATYENESLPVTDVTVEGNRVILHRVLLTGDSYEQASDDQIMSTAAEQERMNMIETTRTDAGNETLIRMHKEVDADKRKLFVAQEMDGEVPVAEFAQAEREARYYTYDHGTLTGIYKEAGAAVADAYDCFGQTLDAQGRYVYYRGNLSTRNQIMSLTQSVETRDYSEENSLNACLKVMLEYEGAGGNVDKLLSEGMSAKEILEQSLSGASVLDLTGCPLSAVLFYADLPYDFPVLVQIAPDAYALLIGFNEQNVVLFNPQRAEENVYKVPISEAEELFLSRGNRFLTYIK